MGLIEFMGGSDDQDKTSRWNQIFLVWACGVFDLR